jgi:prepilin-type N-terminal cleavage/methylation domain-containing protein
MNYIKTINKQARQRGTTLIELSVVIAVILLLVGVLFIGVTAWKAGANKAACILNIATIQKGLRGYENMNNGADPAAIADLVTAKFFQAEPMCPTTNVVYGIATTAPGTAWAVCTDATLKHVPASVTNW